MTNDSGPENRVPRDTAPGRGDNAEGAAALDLARAAEPAPLGGEERLRLVGRVTGFGLFEIDWLARRRYWSPELRALLRVPEGMDISTDNTLLERILSESQRERMREKLKQSLAPGGDGEYEDEHEVTRLDGTPAWILLRGKTFFAETETGRAPARTIGLVVDITARKRAEESNALLASVVMASSDAIFSADANRIIQTWNEGARRLYGYTKEEAIGRPVGILAPDHLREEVDALSERIIRGEHVYLETERRHKSGRLIPVGISSSPIRAEDGRIVGLAAVHRDMTERRRYEEHLDFTLRELSHRTKNVLAVVQALARQIIRQSNSLAAFETRFSGCVQALAYCHDLLVQHDWKGANLDDLIRVQLAPFGGFDGAKLSAHGPPVFLKPPAMQSLGLALHELATNAAKHGALSVSAGSVAISWARLENDRGLRLSWVERGGPRVRRPRREGFGLVVLRRTGAALDGEATLDFQPEGFVWTVTIGAQQMAERGER
ncbi:MAG: PAS domain S-box protein [Variibacter sp.]|nr:PAS domain S-box protein [Variibacter sp.]